MATEMSNDVLEGGASLERPVVEWPCSCAICRLLVHPILRLLRAHSKGSSTTALEASSEAVEISETPILQQPAPAIDVEKLQEAIASHISAIVDSKLREFSSRVEAVEQEVKSVRDDVAKSIDEIKGVMVDLRASIAEASNPFNVLRGAQGSEGRGKLDERTLMESFERALEGLKSEKQVSGQPVEKPSPAQPRDISSTDLGSVSKTLIERARGRLGLNGLIKLIKWVDDMLNRVPREVVEEMAKFMAAVGIVDEDGRKLIVDVADFIYRARKMGIKINEQLLYIYTLAKVFGVEDKEAGDEILKLTVDSSSL